MATDDASAATVQYSGRVRGDLRSRARVGMRGTALEGIISTGGEIFFVQPAAQVCPGADAHGLVVSRFAAGVAPAGPARPARRRPPATAPMPFAVPTPPLAAPPPPTATPPGAEQPAAPASDAATRDAGTAASSAAAQTSIVVKNALAAIGQENLVYNTINQATATSFFFNGGIARDRSVSHTRLYVADSNNSRVLGFECAGANCALPTNAAAVRVFGQPNFTRWQANGGLGSIVNALNHSVPGAVATDTSGTLYVADTLNSRVLIYVNPWADATPDAVLGQSSMNGFSAGSGLNQLNLPDGVFVDASGALWVADTGNNRVLKFTNLTTGASAALALGGAGAASATTLSGPRDVATDGAGNLYVADTGFSRVLRYTAPITNGEPAAAVFGQGGNLASGTANLGGPSANSLAQPQRLHLDAAGRLWVADTGNNRVLEYDTPLTSTTAARVFGQVDRNQVPSFATTVRDGPDGFPNAAGLFHPRGVLTDGAGRLWVGDQDSSRIVGFDNPLAAPPDALVADRVLGKALFIEAFANQPSANRMNNPFGVAVDRSHTPNRLWVADLGNARVLGYASTDNLVTNVSANLVLGQPDFTHGSPRRGLNGPLANPSNAVTSNAAFANPSSVATDSQGGVYVADTSNSRVLKFSDPFDTDTVGDQVLGQTNFTNINPNFPLGTATGFIGPTGVSIDDADNLWVADTQNHRAVRISDAPNQPATGAAADLVLGQAGFTAASMYPAYSPGCTANRFNGPGGVFAAPSGRLYVADFGNHRVLMFTPPFSNGMNASAVFGQASFTACAANRGGAPSNATLKQPRHVFEDAAGNVYIADYGNNRVLVYQLPFAGGDLLADEVLGQPNFSSTSIQAPRPDTLRLPAQIAMDTAGRFFVADGDDSRVTRYATNSGPQLFLDPIPNPIVVGRHLNISGTGFTAGSRLIGWIATVGGVQSFGPLTPDGWTSGFVITFIPPTLPRGNGFVTVVVVNTDQGFIQSNPQSQYLYGEAGYNIPTILSINGVGLRPVDAGIPLASVETAVAKGSTATIGGTGFNNPKVNLFTAIGLVGPLVPLPGGTPTQIQVQVPSTVTTGPGSFQVINSPYSTSTVSNAVSVVLGAQLTISGIMQQDSTVTVTGTGFSVVSLINLFNGGANLGGYFQGQPRIPLTIVSDTQFTFTVPSTAVTGAAYLQVINPPYIPFSTTGSDPDGAFVITQSP